jgi:hypothetical protein
MDALYLKMVAAHQMLRLCGFVLASLAVDAHIDELPEWDPIPCISHRFALVACDSDVEVFNMRPRPAPQACGCG